ncbi:MAG: D-alanyl-D-alanine carboxypeptidase/D-alanyl-D-alanine-endopeptidase [Candidatus Eremiobacteraeota bacterium]|nr:D-alanyl-D-alanine carboxypeptidase/D-alanyl-D-alanine-endopeptidase [Candidatus Eremiobacteraeota bacterium]
MDDSFATAISGADGWSLAVISADGQTIYDDRAYRAVTPASVQKLIVAATGLDVLGSRFRFHTILAGEHAIAPDGSLEGNLWLVGSGDPSFRSEDLESGVKMLAMAGLRDVSGSIAIDAGSMHGPELNPHWDPDDEGEDYAAPTSAVSIDGDTVEFDVTGTSPGEPAEVQVVPASDAISTTGEIVTSSTEGGDDVTIAPQSAPNEFALGGSVPSDAREKYWLPVRGVAAYAGAVLERMLRERNVQAGNPIVAPAPLDSIVLWDHASAPLRPLEAHMLYDSDNHYAEQLLRAVGGERTGTASDVNGIATEVRFLSERGIPTPGLRLLDGSGLADGNRVAAITLARVLSDSELRGSDASLYLLLPLGGRQGTLKQYDFTTALGRVRAKSGHITGVASLAGFVNTLGHGRLAFAFSIDGSPGDPDAAIVRAVNRLAGL